MIRFSIIIASILLITCRNSSVSKSNSTIEGSLVNKNAIILNPLKDSSNQVSQREIEIIANTFANMPLGEFNFFNNKLSNYIKGNYTYLMHPVPNKYSSIIDTTITFIRGNSILRFYKTDNKILLDSLNIVDSNFVLFSHDIDIGMSKKDFLKAFGKDSKNFSDSDTVVNDENSSSVTAIFKDKKLNRIYYKTYFD